MKKQNGHHSIIPRRHNGRFYNVAGMLDHCEEPESLIPSIKIFLHAFWVAKKTREQKKCVTPSLLSCPDKLVISRSEQPIVTWLGHATVLIQVGKINILTDPIMGRPSFLFPRITPFGHSLEQLPPIDYVLISHNHRDHLDKTTVQMLQKRDNPLFLIPEGVGSWFKKIGILHYEEFHWWDSYKKDSIELSFVPAWHWSQRGLFDHNRSLWGGWCMKYNKPSSKDWICYFAGDTAYAQHYFHAIAERFPKIDLALVPIGPCEPHAWMKKSHMNAEQAGQSFLDVKAAKALPMHWATFGFGIDIPTDPIDRLIQWWKDRALSERALVVAKIGQQIVFRD